jgi:hypothetical protein
MLCETLESNIMLFIEEEYIIFYELDRKNIYNEKTNYKHKSYRLMMFYKNCITEFIKYCNLNLNIYYNSLFYDVLSNTILFYNKIFHNKISINCNKKLVFYYNYGILTINILKRRLLLYFIYNTKLKVTLTPGMISKKLDIIEKKAKTSTKIVNLMFRLGLKVICDKHKLTQLIINIKGTRYEIYKYIDLIKRNIPAGIYTFFIFTPNVRYNLVKFKKIKAIKKNLKKKLIKY